MLYWCILLCIWSETSEGEEAEESEPEDDRDQDNDGQLIDGEFLRPPNTLNNHDTSQSQQDSMNLFDRLVIYAHTSSYDGLGRQNSLHVLGGWFSSQFLLQFSTFGNHMMKMEA